jgi:protoheme IX farnesyltransferase
MMAAGEAAAGASVGDFLALLKPRVMSLVVFTGAAGLYLAPFHPHPLLCAVAILCIALAAGAAGAINMWYDRDIDAVMARTCARPIPRGSVAPETALTFGLIVALFSVTIMGLALNGLAAFLLGFTIFFYAVIYTMWLKRRTPQNIVIGGLAGALPPLIGWEAATGEIAPLPLLLTLLIFLWTPPHFWALALWRARDYAAAGVPMMPLTHGEASTKRQILLYTIVLVPVTVAPGLLIGGSLLYLIPAFTLATIFVAFAVAVIREDGYRWAKKMFGYSILHLFLLFLLLTLAKGTGL